MKREIKDGQGFICKDLEERDKIWKKLEDAGYPMFHQLSKIGVYSYLEYPHILYHNEYFCFCKNAVSMPLNEAEFFGENEWTPKPGEWVESSHDGHNEFKRQYLCTINGVHICVGYGDDIDGCDRFVKIKYIRQIQPETITLQEAQDKLRELLNKPNLIIKS
jgi:hypothetical protein